MISRKAILFLLSGLLVGCSSHWVEKNNDEVALYLEAEEVKEIDFVSSISGFQPKELVKSSDSLWVVRLSQPKESFRYFYLVDGQVMIPDCQLKEKDDFGSENCIYDPEI